MSEQLHLEPGDLRCSADGSVSLLVDVKHVRVIENGTSHVVAQWLHTYGQLKLKAYPSLAAQHAAQQLAKLGLPARALP